MRQVEAPARRYRRVPVALRVECVGRYPAATADISEGGFSVVTRSPLPVGSRTCFRLHLRVDERPLELTGVVIWSRLDGTFPGMGVCIEEHDEARREWLVEFVDRLIQDAERL